MGDISKQVVTLYNKQQKAKNDLAIEREKIIKHFQYAREGVAMFTDEDKEILSNILYIQFANLISDTEIRLPEEVIDLPEMAPVKSFLESERQENPKRILRKTFTIDKGGKTFLVECLLFLNKSYEISINDISRQEEREQDEKAIDTEHRPRTENACQQYPRIFGNNHLQSQLAGREKGILP
ncbi:MAG: hypothetical protein L6V92_07665 [Phocaeicola vulgatus]|nr:MAG: hypothetical protein L6V92_07665 [Phocaeicola vulgatus]